MWRLTIYLSVAALSFCAGLSAQMLWHVPGPSPDIKLPRMVSLCELEKDPARYDGEVVRIKAILYRKYGEPFLYDESCGSPDGLEAQPVLVSAEASVGLPEWATYTSFCGNDPYWALVEGLAAEVVIVGSFEAGQLGPGGATDARHPVIITKHVFQLSQASKRR